MGYWQFLLLTLPATDPGLRMRIWRATKSLGAAAPRDGVWLLPDDQGAAFDALATEVQSGGGMAERLRAETLDAAQEKRFLSLFDRSEDYAGFMARVATLAEGPTPGRRQLGKLRRELEHLRSIDFFPGDASASAQAALLELERLAAPDEPGGRPVGLPRLALAEYRSRTWATRARPWVDRLASAWLIRRFVDPEAHILWLARPADCPPGALGFDFDGAAFSHVLEPGGLERVTFEAILISFGLETDAALHRLGQIVHYLDVGGVPAPEAAGLEALLAGMRASLSDDDALLAAAGQAFDFLYTTLQHGASNK